MPSTLSIDTKDALAHAVPKPAHCRIALARALALYGADASGAQFVSRRLAVTRLFWSLLEDRKAHPIIKLAGKRLYRTPAYQISIPDEWCDAPSKPRAKCDRTMELRGAFLASASLSAATTGYHLEFVLRDDARAARLATMLHSFGLEAHRTQRKGRIVLYYKDFDTIGELLTTIGAFGAVLHLEDVRAMKETKNRIHRLVNTEAANVDRAAAAATAQRATILFLREAHGLNKLSAALREIAELRLQHPEETLAELGRRCSPEASKSAVNGRFGALARLAASVRGASKRARRAGSGKD